MIRFTLFSMCVFIVLNISVSAHSWDLKISSSPSKAGVFFDDRNAGVTVFRTNLQTGQFHIMVKENGYKNFSEDLNLTNNASVFVRLSPENSHFTFIKQIKTGHQPKDLIYSPDGRYLMISTMGTDFIQVYDTKDSSVTNIHVRGYDKLYGFIEGVFNRDGSEYWFTQMNEHGRVFVLSMKDFSIKTNIPTHADWTKVGEFTPDYKYYYVSNWLSDDVTIIDPKTYSFVRKFNTVGRAPRGVAFSDDGNFVYVTLFDSGEFIKYSVTNDYKIVKRIKTGGSCGRFRIDRSKGLAYVNNMGVNKFFVYDMKTDKIIKTIPTWDHPDNVKISPDNRYVYVSNRGPNNRKGYLNRSPVDGKIVIYDSENNFNLVEELMVGNQPIGLAIHPGGKILAISNFMDDTVDFYEINI